jgi:hypothetical protein
VVSNEFVLGVMLGVKGGDKEGFVVLLVREHWELIVNKDTALDTHGI